MRISISQRIMMYSALAFLPCMAMAGELDDALNKQKQKPQRRVYSQPAVLDDQGLEIPKAPTDEDRKLDEKLAELERQTETGLSNVSEPNRPRPVRTQPPPTANKNWLTPALLDESAAETKPESDSDAWVKAELARQETLQLEKRLAEEENNPTKESPSLLFPQPSRQPNFSRNQTVVQPSYLTPRAKITPAPKKQEPIKASSMFSATDYKGSSLKDEPFSSERKTSLVPLFEIERSETPSTFSSSWTTPETKPLPPLQRVRRASPIHRADPFSDDFMPEVKTSIWD